MGVSPVLAMRRDHIASACSGMKYFFGGPDGETLLCVLGWGMLYNHGATPGKAGGGADGGAAQQQGPRCANLVYSLREAPEGPRDDRDGGVCVRFEAARDI